jgi:hypothetical protein
MHGTIVASHPLRMPPGLSWPRRNVTSIPLQAANLQLTTLGPHSNSRSSSVNRLPANYAGWHVSLPSSCGTSSLIAMTTPVAVTESYSELSLSSSTSSAQISAENVAKQTAFAYDESSEVLSSFTVTQQTGLTPSIMTSVHPLTYSSTQSSSNSSVAAPPPVSGAGGRSGFDTGMSVRLHRY